MCLKGEEVDAKKLKEQVFSDEQLHPNTNFEILIFRKCVVEPKFTTQEVISLSEVMPEFVNRIVTIALGITSLPKEKDNGSRTSS